MPVEMLGDGHGVLAAAFYPQEQSAHSSDQQPGVEGVEDRALQLAD